MRSNKFPTRYRVGSLKGDDVYWQPQSGYAIERDGSLMRITDLSEVMWFDKDGDLDKIVADLRVSNGELAAAMVGDLYDRILGAISGEEWYAELGHDKAYGRGIPIMVRRKG